MVQKRKRPLLFEGVNGDLLEMVAFGKLSLSFVFVEYCTYAKQAVNG
jgi:hypothetical protein